MNFGRYRSSLLAALVLVALACSVWAQKPAEDLTAASLEDLLNLEVTTVSKKEEKLFQTAAAVYVITQEAIRRSGLTSLPEVLRLAPGLDVARINAHTWAISARGFNGRFANKLLVLIDGRSVYTPAFAGVFWEVQNLPLEDIERIEVIRGPGGALWGANAINGVINIITKHTKDTQGGLVTSGGGSGAEELGVGSLRFGGAFGQQAHYRFFTKYFKQHSLVDAAGRATNDRWDLLQGGFRIDWNFSARDSLTWQGDIYQGETGQFVQDNSSTAPLHQLPLTRNERTGGNLLARWNRVFSPRSNTSLQFYYDHNRFKDGYFDDQLDTFDLDFQHRRALGQGHDLVWGLGYRLAAYHSRNKAVSGLTVTPPKRGLQLFSAFAQDEATLVKNRLRLTLGGKLVHNDYTQLEFQPSTRLLWTPTARQTFWLAVSRAVRTPTRKDRDIQFIAARFPGENGLLNVVTLFGSPNFKSETLLAYEFGYRVQPNHRLSLDWATFYNVYKHLATAEPASPSFVPGLPPQILLPIYYDNRLRARSYGFEAAAHWSVTNHWRLSGNYSLLKVRSWLDPQSQDIGYERTDGNSPNHRAHLRSYLNLPRNFELDTALYYVGRLINQSAPSYTRLDARLGWRLAEHLEMSVGGRNLLDRQHLESNGNNQGVITTEIRRSFYGKLTWSF